MTNSMTTEEWEATLGRQLRDLRLRQNVDQRRLAEQAYKDLGELWKKSPWNK